MKNIAVILAGGIGSRFNKDIPKQFVKVAGKYVIEHTIDCFEKHNQIDEIIVVINKDYLDRMNQIVKRNSWTKVGKIIFGGKERYHSSINAIRECEGHGEANLIFHDAVRPLLDERIITETIEALKLFNAVDVAIPASDTIIQVDLEKKIIEGIPERSKVWQGQTPQGFKLSTIVQAYKLALLDPNFKTTDDCGVVRRYLPNEKIYVVEGAHRNMKLTHIEDLYIVEKLFNACKDGV